MVANPRALAGDDALGEDGRKQGKSAATILIELAQAGATFFHGPDLAAYADVDFPATGEAPARRETWPIRSAGFKQWLSRLYYRSEEKACGSEAVSAALMALEGIARFDGKEIAVHTRLAHHQRTLYLDLADRHWQLVEIRAGDWQIRPARPDDPFRFVRYAATAALPMPDPEARDLAPLRGLFGMADDDWTLLQAWLLGTLHPTGPYPIAVITGRQGAGKSTLCRVLKLLVDPSAAPLRSAPRSEGDLLISATRAHVLGFDNLSYIPDELSDAMCRLSTGGGLAKRTLYSDAEETILEARRPQVINAIAEVATRPDLLDRALLIRLEKPAGRRTEAAILREVERLRPALLGALLNAVADGLAAPAPEGVSLPRMADFGLWAMRGLPSLGVSPRTFADAYRGNQRGAIAVALDASPLPIPLGKLLDERQGEPWTGTASELLEILNRIAGLGDPITRKAAPQGWPKASNALTGKLRRLQAPLADLGIELTFNATREVRTITVARIPVPQGDEDGTEHSHRPGGSDETPSRSSPLSGDGAGGGSSQDRRADSADRRAGGQAPGIAQPATSDADRRDGPFRADRRACPGPHQRGTGPSDGPDDRDDLSRILSDTQGYTPPVPTVPPPDAAPVIAVVAPTRPDVAYTLVTDREGLDVALPALAASPLLCLDTETTGLDPHTAKLRLLTLSTPDHTYIIDCFKVGGWQGPVRPLLADPGRTIVAHNLRFDLGFLLAAGMEVDAACFDTMLAAQLLEAGTTEDEGGARLGYALAAVAPRCAGLAISKGEQRSDWGRDNLSPEQLHYAALDAAILHPLHARLSEEIESAGLGRAWAIECGCLPALAAMAYEGIPFDRQRWLALSDAAVSEQYRTRQRLNALLAGEGVNVFGGMTINYDSPAQVASLLGRLGVPLPVLESGQPDTSEAALSAVADRHPAIPPLLALREAGKLAGTYGVAFVRDHLSGATGRVHADYRQLGAATGRMSCTKPNLQNIPRSRDYRGCFRAPEGRALVKADYSAIELRIAAAIAPDPAMLAAFAEGADLHKRTAASVLDVPEGEVTKEQRQLAKALNFGLIYGMGAKTLVQHARTGYGVALTMQEAEGHRARFFRTYPGLAAWHRRTGDACQPETRTLAGRRRRDTATFTQRLNTPVQGSGADGLKHALGRLWRYRAEAPAAHLVATVHDEIVVECPEQDAPAVAAWLTRHMVAGMAEIVAGTVPIEVEASVARDWAGTPLTEGRSR